MQAQLTPLDAAAAGLFSAGLHKAIRPHLDPEEGVDRLQPVNTQQDAQESVRPEVAVGVVGHRRTKAGPALDRLAREVLAGLVRRLTVENEPAPTLVVVSNLAEGVDQWLSRILLEQPNAALDVVLPCDPAAVPVHFTDDAARAEFRDLLGRARHVEIAGHGPCGDIAYAEASRRVVDQSDILIAVWDGQAERGPGGTGAAVAHARRRGCPVIWIKDDGSGVEEYGAVDAQVQLWAGLRAFNRESVPDAEWRGACEAARLKLQEIAARAEFAAWPEIVRADRLLDWQVRCDLLAQRYQRLTYVGGTALYLLSVLAIVSLAIQTLLLPAWAMLTGVEIVAMVAILALVALAERGRWHGKWMDYRHLAERLRTAFFLRLAGFTVMSRRATHRVPRSPAGQDWASRAFAHMWWSSVWPARPVADVAVLKRFLRSAWLEPQRAYFDRAATRNHAAHHGLERAGFLLFLLALLVATAHAGLGFLPHDESPAGHFHPVLALIGLVAPALGAALAGIRTHREFERNARHGRTMADYLEDLMDRLELTSDPAALIRLLEELDHTLLEENTDWRTAISFRRLEPPA